MKSLIAVLTLSACATVPAPKQPAPKPSMDEVAEAGTYRLMTPDNAQCTAWAVGDHQVMTAGHCCEGGGDFALESNEGVSISAHRVVWADKYDDESAVPVDVCLMSTDAVVAPPLPLAFEMPAENTPVEFIGYPLGKHSHAEGLYVGDIDGPGTHYDDYTATAPCDHGASGSAMYDDAGVYGVLVRVILVGDQVLPGSEGCVASPLSQIVGLLDSI